VTDKDLYGGLARLHILHHAAEDPIFGQRATPPRLRAECRDAIAKVKELFGELTEGK